MACHGVVSGKGGVGIVRVVQFRFEIFPDVFAGGRHITHSMKRSHLSHHPVSRHHLPMLLSIHCSVVVDSKIPPLGVKTCFCQIGS